jgi:hypothetical protein
MSALGGGRLAAGLSACYFEPRAERGVHRGRIGERSRDVGLEHDYVGSRRVAVGVLAPDPGPNELHLTAVIGDEGRQLTAVPHLPT